MRALILHLDYFVDPRPPWAGSGDARLSDDHFTTWPERRVRYFLEDVCGLRRESLVAGTLLEHREASYFAIREGIASGSLEAPLDLVHVGSGSGLGESDGGWFYVLGRLLNLPVERRADPDANRVTAENYLLFALAACWIGSLALVSRHLVADDLLGILFRESNPASGVLELKAYDHHLLERSLEVAMDPPSPLSVEAPVPFRLTRDIVEPGAFDRVFVTRAPGFTPRGADALVPVVMEYVRPSPLG